MNISLQRRTIFVTFYSFKGGVGRTMALLNAACILAGRGRRVLMIDFDLEAPGLTFLALKQLAVASEARPSGLVELINDFLDDPTHSPLADRENKSAFRDRYIRELQIPASLQRLEGGCLDLMPCGKLDETYEERLYSIKFDELYAEGIGQPLFKHLKNVIRESKLYDYILIDSRTGFSDEGGISTRDLADHIFVVMGLNRQNVEGTTRFLHRLKAIGWPQEQVSFIASPVPTGQEALRDERLQEASQAISGVGFQQIRMLLIPYHPRLALDEEPFDYDWSKTDLFPTYLQLQHILRELAGDNPQSLGQEAIDAINHGQYEKALVKLHEVREESSDAAVSLLLAITGPMMEDSPELRAHAKPFFQLWLDIVGHSVRANLGIRLRFGLYFINQGEYQSAAAELEGALTTAILQKIESGTALAWQCIGLFHHARGQYDEALREYNEALEIHQKTNDLYNVAAMKLAIGSVYSAQGEYDTALRICEEALQTFEQIGDPGDIAAALGNVGHVKVQMGNFTEGRREIEEANRSLEERQKFASLAGGYLNYGEALLLEGDATAAVAYLNEHWEFIQRYGGADLRYAAHVVRAKIKRALGDTAGAAEDAHVARDFYRAQEVHTRLAEEAEELAQLGEKPPS